MDLSPFKRDIDELIAEYAEGGLTSFSDMKKVWHGRKFTYMFEASPSSNLVFFMQSLYAHSIGYMVRSASLSHRLGGLYCLYCLYELQPFKPPFKIYLSIGEIKKLKNLVLDAKHNDVKVVSYLVRKMLEKNMFLFGFVDNNESNAAEAVNQLTELQNARIQVAFRKLFTNTQIESFLHMDLGMEVGVDMIKKMSTEYADAKKLAISEGSEVVDIQDIKHISEDDKHVGDEMEKITQDWTVQRETLYQRTRLLDNLSEEVQQHEYEYEHEHEHGQQLVLRQQDDQNFDQELEQLLLEP